MGAPDVLLPVLRDGVALLRHFPGGATILRSFLLFASFALGSTTVSLLTDFTREAHLLG